MTYLLEAISNFLKKYSNKKYLFMYILGINLFFISFLVIIGIGSTLTADDYQFFSVVNNQSVLTSLANYGSEISGRYSFAITIVASIKLFGLRALEILPVASLFLLIGGVLYASVRYLKIIKRDSPSSMRLAVATAPFAVLGSLITAPSIFDTFVWFSATPVYVTSFAVLFVAISIVFRDLSDKRIRPWLYITVFALLLFAAGFIEVMPVELMLIGVFGLMLSIGRKKDIVPSNLKTKLKLASVLFIASGLVGGIILRLSPWTSLRIASGHHYTTHETLNVTLNHLQLIPQFIFSWHVLFSLVLGILAYLCIGKISSSRNRVVALIVSISLIIIPLLIVGALAALSGLIEATGMGSSRLLYIGTSSILLGTSLLIYFIIDVVLGSRLKSNMNFVLPSIAVLSVFICFMYSTSSLSNVGQAVYTKKSMVQYREAVIANDLATDRATIRIMPASILIANSQINDIGFGSPKTEVWSGALYDYYHIPRTKKLDFASQAPPGYCTLLSSSVIYGKQTCSDIVHSANNLDYTTYP